MQDILDRLYKANNGTESMFIFLQTIINSIPDPIFVKDSKHRWLILNDALCDFIGMSRENLIGKSDHDIFPKEQADVFWEKDEEVFKSRIENINEEHITDTQGVEHIISTKKAVFVDTGTGEPFLVGVIRDITDIKEAHKKLEEKEHYQKALLDNFPFLVWLKDNKSRFLAVNQPFADACHTQSSDDLIGKNDLDFFPNELAQMYRKDDMEVIASGKSKNAEEQFQDKDKDKRTWIETYKSPVSLDGNVIGTVGFARDITQRKKDEEELQLAASVFSHSLEGIFITSAENKIIKANNAVERISGYTQKELLGKNPKILSSGQHSKEFYKLMWDELNTHGYWTGEISNCHKDGSIYIEMITITSRPLLKPL